MQSDASWTIGSICSRTFSPLAIPGETPSTSLRAGQKVIRATIGEHPQHAATDAGEAIAGRPSPFRQNGSTG